MGEADDLDDDPVLDVAEWADIARDVLREFRREYRRDHPCHLDSMAGWNAAFWLHLSRYRAMHDAAD